jgi:hypothetical protein
MTRRLEVRLRAGPPSLSNRLTKRFQGSPRCSTRNLSRTLAFDAAEGQVVAFRCTGKRFLPIFLVSFVLPRLALSLRPE